MTMSLQCKYVVSDKSFSSTISNFNLAIKFPIFVVKTIKSRSGSHYKLLSVCSLINFCTHEENVVKEKDLSLAMFIHGQKVLQRHVTPFDCQCSMQFMALTIH